MYQNGPWDAPDVCLTREKTNYLVDERRKGRVAVDQAVLTEVFECTFLYPR